MHNSPLLISSNKPGEPFARAVAEKLHVNYVPVYEKLFSDGEPDYQVMGHIRGSDFFFFCPFYPDPMTRLSEVQILGDAIKYSSPGRITLVPTYLGFMKKDWKDKPHVPITIRATAVAMEQYANRVLTMDMHSNQIQAVFRIPVDHLGAKYTFREHMKNQGYSKEDTVIVAPDIGAVKRARDMAEVSGLKFAIVYQLRDRNTGEKTAEGILGKEVVEGKRALLIDDQAVSLGTMVDATRILMEDGRTQEVIGYNTHGLMTEKEGFTAERRLADSLMTRLYITDTIWRDSSYFDQNPKIGCVSVVDEFQEAVRRIHNNESLSELFGNS